MKTSDSSCRDTCQNKERCFFGEIDSIELIKYGSLSTYTKNQSIFLLGEIPMGIFCVYSGKIKIVVNIKGKESIVRLVGPGDIFGHRALFGDTPYHVSAIALEDSVVNFFNKKFIFNSIRKYESLAHKFLKHLSNLLEVAEINNATLVHQNVRERLAGLLITFIKSYGVQDDEGICLDIILSREEMAATIGTTHETLVRLLSEFKNEEIIIIKNKFIFIINEAKLIEFANI